MRSMESAASLRRFLSMLESQVPRVLSVNTTKRWFVYTDASHEPESGPPEAGLGAILVDEAEKKIKFFSKEVTDQRNQAQNIEEMQSCHIPVCTAQGGSGSFKERKPIGGWLL